MEKTEYGRVRLLREWIDWNNELHEEQEQIKRQGYAMTYPFTFNINDNARTGKFSSSLGGDYKTTLTNCTCGDFSERNKPCKHIYRLAYELKIIEIFKRPTGSGSPEEFQKGILDVVNSGDIDSHPEQVKRQASAVKCKIIDFNSEEQTAVFAGSGKTPYTTSISKCSCRDYSVRRLPCKHIYKLRQELEGKK